MTRADRATFRPEFAARFSRLLEQASTGRQALAAQGALSVLWHEHSTAAGFVPLTANEVAGVLDVDARTWRDLQALLGSAGLLHQSSHGYQIPDPLQLEGTSHAQGTDGFLRTHRRSYSEVVERLRRAAALEGHRGAYVLAALGALERVRMRANWLSGHARWSATAAAHSHQVTPKTWAGYLRLLEHALVLDREGSRIRVLGWDRLSWGPSWRRSDRAAEVSIGQDLPTSVDDGPQDLPDSSTVKARTSEVTNTPQPPKPASAPRPTTMRLRRGEHDQLPSLFEALEEREPAAAHGRWRRSVRRELSHALAATGGDAGALAVELLRRELTSARDIPATLGYRCAAAVEVIRTRQAAQAATQRLRKARVDQEAQEALSSAQRAAERDFGARLESSQPDIYLHLLTVVANHLGAPPPGSPAFSPGLHRMVEAEARARVRSCAGPLPASELHRLPVRTLGSLVTAAIAELSEASSDG
ncbi:MAG: hypothetical protein ACJ71Y_01190 [Blastococcus sp.]